MTSLIQSQGGQSTNVVFENTKELASKMREIERGREGERAGQRGGREGERKRWREKEEGERARERGGEGAFLLTKKTKAFLLILHRLQLLNFQREEQKRIPLFPNFSDKNVTRAARIS